MVFNQTFYYVPSTSGQSTSAQVYQQPPQQQYVQQYTVHPGTEQQFLVYEQPPGFEQLPSSSNAVYQQPPQLQYVQQYTVHPKTEQQFLVYEQPPGFEQLPSSPNAVQVHHQPPQNRFPGQREVSKQGKHAVLVYDVPGGRISKLFGGRKYPKFEQLVLALQSVTAVAEADLMNLDPAGQRAKKLRPRKKRRREKVVAAMLEFEEIRNEPYITAVQVGRYCRDMSRFTSDKAI
ncbi:hypothetical protein Aduo_008289 [Ancylostoma duodenale]